ncbi:hypothetical protein F4824DRAFT_461041 [Ustulina deusta]|nr:hypothetical protein F4824DRAFT_461041 [Ustulina deusta]
MVFRILALSRNVATAGIAVVLSILLLLSFRSSLLPYIPQAAFQNEYPHSLLEAIANGSFSATTPNTPHPSHSQAAIGFPKSWQIMLPHPNRPADTPSNAERLADTLSWLARNPGYSYTLVGQSEADDFIHAHFSGDENITRA